MSEIERRGVHGVGMVLGVAGEEALEGEELLAAGHLLIY